MMNSIGFAQCIACWLTTADAQMTVVPEKEIRELEAKRLHAMEKADVVTLEGILSDDLIYTHAMGRVRANLTCLEPWVRAK
jgi:hypothetical protein